jgi:hypothetical protein
MRGVRENSGWIREIMTLPPSWMGYVVTLVARGARVNPPNGGTPAQWLEMQPMKRLHAEG